MARLLYVVLLVAAAAGGWYFYTHYEVLGLEGLTVNPRGAEPGGARPPARRRAPSSARKAAGSSAAPERTTIRIATFNLGPLDQIKVSNRKVAGHLAQAVRRFDIVAVQNVQDRNGSTLVQLVEQVNSDDRHYDFAADDDARFEPVQQYSAFLFDRDTIEIDRRTVYRVEDLKGQFRRRPLVASFRAHEPDPAEAFTFTLINVHNDPNRAVVELDLLDDVVRAVRDDGRGEDDVILLGDLAVDDRHFGQLAEVPNIVWCVSGMPSTLRESRLVDNVLFDRRATTEFTGRSGVMDLMDEFDLPMRDVLEISDHFPVWAEFSAYEGGQAGQVPGEP